MELPADRPNPRDLSTRALDCLKILYKLRERGVRATTSALREWLQAREPSGQLSDASVTQLFKALAERGYVRHVRYRGVELTETGDLLAAELVRHHRLLELYLVQHLGYRWDEVDAEADRMEHAISEVFEDRLDALLGHPTADPHGDPIPSKTGQVLAPPTQPLATLEVGTCATVRRVHDDDASRLRYLAELGLMPGTLVCLVAKAPFGGPLHVRVSGASEEREHAVGPELAREVHVEVLVS